MIIAFETGFVPPNINFTSPRDDIDALADGTIRIITEAIPLKNGYVGIDSFGFGGANAHLLVKWNPKIKINNGAPIDNLPRLVVLSGRTEEAVKSFLNDVSNYSETATLFLTARNIAYTQNVQYFTAVPSLLLAHCCLRTATLVEFFV